MCDCRNVTMGVRLSAGTHEECFAERKGSWLGKEGFLLRFGFPMVTVLNAEVREHGMRVLRQKSESVI